MVREDVHGAAHGVLRRPDDDDVLAAHGIDVAARENATGSEPPVYSRLMSAGSSAFTMRPAAGEGVECSRSTRSSTTSPACCGG